MTNALVIILPVLQDLYPQMAAENQEPNQTPMFQPAGFLALNYGTQTLLVTVLAQVYGAIVSAAYARSAESPERLRPPRARGRRRWQVPRKTTVTESTIPNSRLTSRAQLIAPRPGDTLGP